MADDWSEDIPTSLEVGQPPNNFLNITATVPPVLVNYYASLLSAATADFAILMNVSATQYFFIVGGTTPAGPFVGMGWVINGTTVLEVMRPDTNTIVTLPQFELNPGTIKGTINLNGGTFRVNGLLDIASGSIVVHTGALLNILGTLQLTNALLKLSGTSTLQPASALDKINFDFLTNGGDWTINGNSQGRGLIYSEEIVVNVSTPAAASEAVVYTTFSTIDFPTGRAYKVELLNSRIQSAVAQNPQVRLREGTTIGGTALQTGPRINIPAINTDFPLPWGASFVNTSGATVTTNLSLTLQPSAATAVQLSGAAAPVHWTFNVYDIDSSNGYAGISL